MIVLRCIMVVRRKDGLRHNIGKQSRQPGGPADRVEVVWSLFGLICFVSLRFGIKYFYCLDLKTWKAYLPTSKIVSIIIIIVVVVVVRYGFLFLWAFFFKVVLSWFLFQLFFVCVFRTAATATAAGRSKRFYLYRVHKITYFFWKVL